VGKIADALGWSAAAWIVTNAIVWPIAMYNAVPGIVPMAYSIISYPVFMRMFGKVPVWHNAVQKEPPAQPKQELEHEDRRHFVGWETGAPEHDIEWYTPDIPLPQARSYALAVVNNNYAWVAEDKLKLHNANISQSNYRLLRLDWIARQWCYATNDGKTIVRRRSLIHRIAFEEPK